MSRILLANKQSIAHAAKLIKAGEIVGLPTETVYGLGADATNKNAVRAIFKAKNRPAKNPLIIHVANKKQALDYGVITKSASTMIEAFWPGPLTLILNQVKGNNISDLVTAGLDTIAIRCPAHPVMAEVIRLAKCPIAAPSANASGEPSATTPNHVAQSLGNNIDVILGAGACEVGIESTVLDLTTDVPIILRPGGITLEEIQKYLPAVQIGKGSDVNNQPKSPGQLFKHYAPSIPIRLNAIDVRKGEALLSFGSIKFMGIVGGGSAKDLKEDSVRSLSDEGDLEEAAKNLFTMIRDLDNENNNSIAVMNIPEKGIGIAINERLRRAAEG